MSTREPSIVVIESELRLFDQHLEASAELNELCQSLVQRAPSRSLAALFEGLQSRILAVSAEAGSLVEWLTIAQPEVPAEPAIDPAVMERAKTTKSRFAIKRAAAGLQASIADKKKWLSSAKAEEKKLGQLLHDNANTLGADIVKLLSQNDHFSWQGWKDLAEAYRLLEQETGRIEDGQPAQPEKIATAVLKHGALIEGTHGPKQDVDVDWLRGFMPGEAQRQPTSSDLATAESFAQRLGQVQIVTTPEKPAVPTKPYVLPIERCRLKADVARVKGRIERAELLGQDDEDATAELLRLKKRHTDFFQQDGYVFGFSVLHHMDPSDWDRLSGAYNDLAVAWEEGFTSTLNAKKCLEAVEALRAAMKPAGSGLLGDDDADLLKREVKAVHPKLKLGRPDPFLAFVSSFADLPENVVYIADLAAEALTAGVKPSDPRLRDPLIDWYDSLLNLDRPYLKILLREVGKEIERQQRVEDEEEDARAEDPHYTVILQKVLAITAGKKMLMVGGRNREDSRRAIQAELQLAELVWAESDEHMTKAGDFDVDVDHADIVVKNRWCRRGYQRALVRAREQGKRAFAIRAGYNARQIVRAIAEQAHLD